MGGGPRELARGGGSLVWKSPAWIIERLPDAVGAADTRSGARRLQSTQTWGAPDSSQHPAQCSSQQSPMLSALPLAKLERGSCHDAMPRFSESTGLIPQALTRVLNL